MLFKKYFTDPCGEDGTCLVKASCNLKQNMPWFRTDKCPDYRKYVKIRNTAKNIIDWIIAGFWMLVCLLIVVYIVAALGWGVFDLTKKLWNWL